MPELEHILTQFEPIALAEMDSVRLMDRTDTKFTFKAALLPKVLEQLGGNYRILSIEGLSICTYKTLYFDTADFALYRKHQSGSLNRYKIRYRNYVESGLGFLEVKLKNNKGRTIKERIKHKEVPQGWNEKSQAFLEQKTPYDPTALEPRLWVNYQRITLVDKAFRERVTIDLNLEFENGENCVKLHELAIAEVKRGSRTQSKMVSVLRALRIRPLSLSKYCLGITHVYPFLKKNNFKEKLTTINKIIHDNAFKLAPGC